MKICFKWQLLYNIIVNDIMIRYSEHKHKNSVYHLPKVLHTCLKRCNFAIGTFLGKGFVQAQVLLWMLSSESLLVQKLWNKRQTFPIPFFAIKKNYLCNVFCVLCVFCVCMFFTFVITFETHWELHFYYISVNCNHMITNDFIPQNKEWFNSSIASGAQMCQGPKCVLAFSSHSIVYYRVLYLYSECCGIHKSIGEVLLYTKVLHTLIIKMY